MSFVHSEVGGTLQLGKIGTPDVITSTLHLGYNVKNPLDTYFYSKISTLTLGSIVKAFNIKIDLTQPLKDTGFPTGLAVSFTSNPAGT